MTAALTCVLLLALGTFATACGDSDELTLKEYFQRVEEILGDSDNRAEALEGAFPGAFEEPAATSDFFRASATIFGEANDKMDDIDAPTEVQEAHNKFVAATVGLLDVTESIADGLADVGLASEFGGLLELKQPEFDAANERMEAACRALQSIADDNGIAIDLGSVDRDCDALQVDASGAPVPLETPAPPVVRRTPPPQLLIVGNQIQNTYGERVVLRGVAIDQPTLLANSPRVGHFAAEDYRVLADDWGANIIRVPVYPRSWTSDPLYMEKYLDPLVQWGGESGIYIFLGWRAHGNPVTGQEEKPYLSPDLELAESALTAMAERYRDKPWVLYGTFNEPTYISWSEWRPVAERLVDTVHEVNPEAVVFVSGVDWGYDLKGVIKDPVRRNNIIYETHPYPGKGEGWKGVLDELRKTTPVFLGEWGFEPGAEDRNLRGTAEKYGDPLLQYAKERNIGWTAWQWRLRYSELGMLESWDGYKPTEWGFFIKEGLSQ